MMRFFRAAAGMLLVASVFLAGCATSPHNKMPKAVEDRAIKRWDLLIAGQTAEAYDYLAPGYRQTKPKDIYTKENLTRPVQWTSVKYMDKDCHEDACTVRVYLTYKVKIHVAVPVTETFSVLQEKWVKVDGEWFYLPDRLGSSKVK